MKQVIELRNAGQEAISRHAFFDWLSSDKIPARDRLAMARPEPSSSCSSETSIAGYCDMPSPVPNTNG